MKPKVFRGQELLNKNTLFLNIFIFIYFWFIGIWVGQWAVGAAAERLARMRRLCVARCQQQKRWPFVFSGIGDTFRVLTTCVECVVSAVSAGWFAFRLQIAVSDRSNGHKTSDSDGNDDSNGVAISNIVYVHRYFQLRRSISFSQVAAVRADTRALPYLLWWLSAAPFYTLLTIDRTMSN